MPYAEVAVNAPVVRPRTFSYAIPPGMALEPGHAVWVPFGPRVLQGIVFAVGPEPSVEEIRDIAQLIDPRPLLFPYQVELARWVAEQYLSSYFEAASLMLPPGFERKVLSFITPLPTPEGVSPSLSSGERRVLNLLRVEGKLGVEEVKRMLGAREGEAVVRGLLRKGLMARGAELQRARVKPAVERYLKLAVGPAEVERVLGPLEKRRALRQAELLRLLSGAPLRLAEAKRRCGQAAVAAVGRKGLAVLEEVPVWRDPLAHRTFAGAVPPTLTPEQEAAWSEMRAALDASPAPGISPQVFLLHGVTGSGKTELYLRAASHAVAQGRRALVLVPEIALTPQTIERFAARFPGGVAVLHSRLSLGEQYDEWHRIREGAFPVVIGSRGAVFSPQPNLGLIVIDEEHEWTYKQHEQAPRYHAREVALKLAELAGAVVVLGSATPDLVSYHRAQRGQYRLLQLLRRVAVPGSVERPMPEVEVVDLRQELRSGNRGIFSRSLAAAITSAVAAGEQVILFINRRGTASFVQCRDCGYVMRCRRCAVSMTYHSRDEDLICHQCNYRTPVPAICPNCLGKRIRFLGIGTQKVEEEAARAFPGARLLRWDRDMTGGRRSHEDILRGFVSHEADILIGTQMIAKGLDLPLVTLVGVVNADVNLHLPDFRAGERTFQLLTQVAGRAGRGPLGGRVIVQSYTPEHYGVAAAAHHDYAAFYRRELAFRREQGNPPFNRLARLLYLQRNATLCQREAERMYGVLEQQRQALGLAGVSLIGPSPAYIQRVRGRYRWQIVVRAPDPLALLEKVPVPRGWTVDIDPASLL